MEKIPVSKHNLLDALRFVPALNLTYLNNQKVACTSIKVALWKRSDEVKRKSTFGGVSPHSLEHGPWRNLLRRNPANVQSSTFFTVIRDPYARLLSAFLNKRNKPPEVPFVRWCENHIGGVPKTFPEFVRRIVDVPEQNRDRHIRPQWINILWPYIRFDFIGRMEEMDEVERFLSRHDIKPIRWKLNASGASARLEEYYDDETRRLVTEAYADDLKLWRRELPPAETTTISDLLRKYREPRRPNALARQPQ